MGCWDGVGLTVIIMQVSVKIGLEIPTGTELDNILRLQFLLKWPHLLCSGLFSLHANLWVFQCRDEMIRSSVNANLKNFIIQKLSHSV